MTNNNAKRIWLITDTHLGVRNSSNEWIEIIEDYFYNWFIPTVKKNYQPGDILLHLGDVYDSRQSLNIKVLNLGIKIFEDLSQIFTDGIYIINGNHDSWSKTSNEINSLKTLKWIPNINIFEEPVSINFSGKSFFLMPWRKDHEDEEKTLDETKPHDYLCCHADIRGLKFNKYTSVETGATRDKFFKFGRVYSGHIHYSQEVNNIKMLGSPYEITRSDMGNPKGITLLNLSNGEETYFENNHSPKFKKLLFSDILNMTIEEIEPIFRNNFVDVMIDPRMALKAPLNILTDSITTQKRLNFHPYDPDQASPLSIQMLESEGKQFDVLDFIREYVDSMEITQEEKEKIKRSLYNLYHKVIERQQEGKLL